MIQKFIYSLCIFSFVGLSSLEKISFKYLESKTNPLTDSSGAFGFSLYQALNQKDKNLIISPYSISSCLYMVYLGAEGNTAKQMHKALKLKISQEDLPIFYRKWNKKMLEEYESCFLYNINSGWADKTAPVLFQYNQILKENFHAQINNVDFVSHPKKQIEKINNWMREKTKGKIPYLLDDQSINSDTRLLLTSVLYFKSPWQKPFSSENTSKANFKSSDQTITIVPMMHQRSFFPFFESSDFRVIILPFACSRFGLVILLPKKEKSLQDISKKLSLRTYLSFFPQMEEQHIDLKMPKFSLNEKFDLDDALQTLGMQRAFETTADFSGINGRLDLYLSKVIHQAVIQVDEHGILATAATTSGMHTTSYPSEKPIAFHVNRDFLFFICDLQDYSLLFLGKVDHLPGI